MPINKLILRLGNLLPISVLLLISNIAWANYALQPEGPSLGTVATNLTSPIGTFTQLFYNICYIIGAMLVMGSGVQYKQYRNNPLQTPISKPIVLFILGGVFILLPFITQLSSAASAATS